MNPYRDGPKDVAWACAWCKRTDCMLMSAVRGRSKDYDFCSEACQAAWLEWDKKIQ